MKPVFKILLPVTAALVLGVGVIGVLSLQLNWSAADLRARLAKMETVLPIGGSNEPQFVASADTGDSALIALRQGDLLVQQKEWEDAEQAYRDAVAKGAGLTAEKKLTLVLLQRRKFDEVAAAITNLKSKGLRSEDALLLESLLALHTGKTSDALRMLTDAEDSPQKHYGLSLAAIAQGSHDTARMELTKVIEGFEPLLRANAQILRAAYDDFEKFPSSTPIHLTTLLARALALVNECELALPMLSSVIGQMPDYRDAWIVLGFCQLNTERFLEARGSFEEAYKRDPEKSEIQYYLGLTYVALNDWDNAQTFLQYALRNGLKPEKGAHVALAAVYQKQGRPDEAFAQMMTVAGAEDATREDVIAAAESAVATKKVPQFMETLRKAIEKWPEDSGLHVLLGRLSLSQGNTADAKAAFQKVLELDPANTEAKEALGKL